jgi:hypothetical protein|tara:strand:+ start:358 stop:552 length:195 start_codon:yes stop_codon:yes gene_type:complete
MSIETVKLVNKKGEVIERYKHDYENNVERFNMRGWSLQTAKKVSEPVKVDKVIKKVAKKKKSKK